MILGKLLLHAKVASVIRGGPPYNTSITVHCAYKI